MKIYHYHELTKELVHESIARQSPIQSDTPEIDYLIPRNATKFVPKKDAGLNQAEIFNGSRWVKVPDYRGKVFYDALGVEHEINELNIIPDTTWTETRPFILNEAKEQKKTEIRAKLNQTLLQPVIVKGINYSSGIDSALKLDGAKRLAVLAGLADVTFYDVNNVGHQLTIANAENVIVSVGANYQTVYAKKQAFMSSVDALAVGAVQADIDAIIVSY